MNFEIAPKSTEIQANWDDARLYCFALNIDGKTGWRLPTTEELDEIYESENDFFVDGNYWSSSEIDINWSWGQAFDDGYQTNYWKEHSYYVRAIRSVI